MLTERQTRFIDAYKQSGNASEAARLAGYSINSAHVEGARLLRHAKVKAEIDAWRVAKKAELSRTDFVSTALKEYDSEENPPAVRIRSLEIVGRALGHLGGDSGQVATINNNTQININLDSLSPADKWAAARKLLE